MILNKDEIYNVVGEIYKITNTTTGKNYIGQTRSHRLNHNKYRPFGYLGRFKDHIHEAYSNKKNHSRYLNYSLRKYGEDCFTCEQILTCKVNELDELEKQFILEYNSKFPNGYNLTDGGKGFTDVKGEYIWRTETQPMRILEPRPKTDYTKQLISERLKSFYTNNENCEKRMRQVQEQHLTKKYDRFKDVVIVDDDVDKYIRVLKNNTNNTEYVRIVINNKRITTFVGKHETIEEIKHRAKKFILQLKEWQRGQIAGISLEPQTTTP
jgi:hypothetical protein